MPHLRRALAISVILLAPIALAWRPVQGYLGAARLLEALATGPISSDGREVDLSVPGRHGPIRARLYAPSGGAARRALVVAHGVHYQGIDERRLVPFARSLATQGFAVLTPELRDLADYRITHLGVDVIADSVRFLGEQASVPVAAERVGMLGFSFAGGLSLVAATQPSLRERVAYVVSIGGHHDLSRVMRFLVTDRVETPDGARELGAHEYGLVVAIHGLVEHFVPEPDRELMRDALRAWLQEDRPRAARIASRRTTAAAEHLFTRLESGRLGELRERLLVLFGERDAELARLSPRGKLRNVPAPVYLLHGSADTVIPPVESEWAERELAGRPHRALISPLLQHVAVDRAAGYLDRLALLDFMAALF